MTDYEFIQILSDNSRSHNEHERAFSDFYRRNRSRFIGYIRGQKMKYDDETICDWYQDSCVILYDAIRCGKLVDADKDIQLISYLFSVGYNKYADRCRKGIYQQKYNEEIKAAADDISYTVNGKKAMNYKDVFDRICEEQEMKSVVFQTVHTMAEPCNRILTLFYYEEMNGWDIANLCGYANENSVKTQKYKCMRKLKTYIKNLLK